VSTFEANTERNYRTESCKHESKSQSQTSLPASAPAPAPIQFSAYAAESTTGPALCNRIRARLEANLGANKVRRYLGTGVEMVSETDGLSVTASSRFTLDMIEKQIGEDLRSTLREQVGNPAASIRYSLRESAPAAVEVRPTPGRDAGNSRKSQVESLIAGPAPTRGPIRKNLPSCPTIEGFLVGHANKLAFGAIEALLESPGVCPPVFIHGSCGVGKTHLLRATAQRYRQMIPGAKVRYITGEAFVNSFVQAIRTKTVEAFEKKFRGLDVLCLDDVHMVAGKESTQHELLQIFNTLSLSGAKVILASDAPPNEIARLSSGLASRFNGGVVARIDTPDRSLALRIARQICIVRGMSIDDAGLGAILDRIGIGQHGGSASVRELEGAIVQVQAVARLLDQDQNGVPSVTSIHRALQLRTGNSGPQRSLGPISMDLITHVVLEHLGVTKQDLRGRGRHRTVVLARELIVHLSRAMTTHSFPEIAHSIGRPNHSTVITAAKRIRGRIESLERCVQMGPESGITVKGLVDELTERVRMSHRQASERVKI
tara:strand:- start:68594 stop:70228 length:1635 start_codon:yes stop_codon:yes gene_type:complete